MVPPSLRTSRLITAVVLVTSVIVLAIQLANPPGIVVASSGSDANITEIGSYFTYWEVSIIAIAAWLIGTTSTLLVTDSPISSPDEPQSEPNAAIQGEQRPREEAPLESRDEIADQLSDTERVVYETVLEADGTIAQSDLVDRTDLSKATVSRTLDTLESKELVERKRHGMGNRVVLC